MGKTIFEFSIKCNRILFEPFFNIFTPLYHSLLPFFALLDPCSPSKGLQNQRTKFLNFQAQNFSSVDKKQNLPTIYSNIFNCDQKNTICLVDLQPHVSLLYTVPHINYQFFNTSKVLTPLALKPDFGSNERRIYFQIGRKTVAPKEKSIRSSK